MKRTNTQTDISLVAKTSLHRRSVVKREPNLFSKLNDS